MDCKITFLNRGLYCDAHQSKGMSALCDVAEQELREAITQLQKTVSLLRAQLTEEKPDCQDRK